MLFDAWREQGICRGMPPGLFFSEDLEDLVAAKTVCFACPVQEECLDAAVRNGEDYGVWGGVGQEGRRSLASILLTGDVFAYSQGLRDEIKSAGIWIGKTEDDRPFEPAGVCELCGDPVRPGKLPTRRPGPNRTCGNPSTYDAGCRCDRCVRAKVRKVASDKERSRASVPARGQVGSASPTQPKGVEAMDDTEVLEPETEETEEGAQGTSEADARIAELETQLGLLELELEANDRLSLQMFPEELFRARALDTSQLDPKDPEAYAKLMFVLQRIEDGVQFWLGDAMQWGEEAFDAAVWNVIASRVKFKTLMNYRRVCEILPEGERYDELDWGIHRVIAETFPKTKKERTRAFGRATKAHKKGEPWTYSAAATYCRDRKAELNGVTPGAKADESARDGDNTVDSVDGADVVWAVRISSSPDESAAVQAIATKAQDFAEKEIADSGLYSAKVAIVYANPEGTEED